MYMDICHGKRKQTQTKWICKKLDSLDFLYGNVKQKNKIN